MPVSRVATALRNILPCSSEELCCGAPHRQSAFEESLDASVTSMPPFLTPLPVRFLGEHDSGHLVMAFLSLGGRVLVSEVGPQRVM